MDRNEVLLVGRLSAAAEDKTLPGGDVLTKWRLIVRRRRHRRGSTVYDSLPCVTFDPVVAAVVHGLRPRDPLQVSGSLRLRVYGPTTAKVFNYEVEVEAASSVTEEEAMSPVSEEVEVTSPVSEVAVMQVEYLAPTG
ncbi:single-stranded DNA-binding protein [Nonomuraea sp. NPDC050536]|uniref:single-stranded DNA-binding protein n=1 Tax=Nonomuraea sp. NPDC050536 TaxID=3364366 RepID=UPI0037C888C1